MEPYPEIPAFKILDDAAENFPSNNACRYLGNKISFKELKDDADKLAAALSDMGIGKEDKVATILPSSPQFLISDFAIMKTGATHVPCSTLHKTPDLKHEIGGSGAKTVICFSEALDLLKSITSEIGIKNKIITSKTDYTPEETETEEIQDTYHLKNLLEDYPPEPPEVEINPKEDLAWLAFTGGTTGMPKGVMITHHNITSNVRQLFPWMLKPLEAGLKGKSSVLIPVHLFHAYGHIISFSAINWGLQMLLVPDPRNYELIAEFLNEYKPFMALGVPTQFMKLVSKDIDKMQTLFMSSAAALPAEIEDEFGNLVGVPMSEGYGMTEATAGTHMNLSALSEVTGFMAAKEKRGIGVPLPDTEVKIVDPETHKEVPINEPGEIAIRGPQIMEGYWPERGDGLENGWFYTGDIGRMDEDGYFKIEDRIKDTINISGFRVFPRRIDDTIVEIPEVEIAASVGVPDPDRPGNEKIKAFVVLKEGKEGKVTKEQIINHCKEKLPPYSVPKLIEFRKDLPTTVTQKVMKRKLVEE